MICLRNLIRVGAVVLLTAALAACGGDSRDKLASSAKDFLAKGERNAAIIQLKNLLQKSPDDGEARLLLGQTYLEKGDYLLAEIELRRALELEQPADQVIPALARVLMARRESQKLLDEFAGVKLKDRSAISEFRALLGDAYLRAGRRDEAKAQYEAALAARSDNRQAQLGLAMLDAVQGNMAEASRKVEEVLARAPDFADAKELKADLQLKQGDLAGAKKAYEEVLAIDPPRESANLSLAAMLIDEGAYEDAGKRLSAIRRGSTFSLRLTFLEGLLALRQGDIAKARERALRILGPRPEHVPSLILAGAIELAAGQFSSAEAYLRRALSLSPIHQGARRLLVAVYVNNGQPVRAREMLEELFTQLKEPDPQLLMLAGETYLANGDMKRAAAFFERASAGDPTKAAARTKLGELAFAAGDPVAGFRELEAATELDPSQTRADVTRIVAYLQRKEADKALAVALVLEKKRPQTPLAHQMLGLVHLARKDVGAARKSLERSVELQPTYLPSVIELARLDLADGKADRARKRFESVIEKDPRNEQAYLLLAEVQARTGSAPADVRGTLQRAVQANPASARARLALISMQLAMKDRKAALASIHDAIVTAPDDTVLLDGIASVQERLGEKNQALETLKQLIALQPQSPQPLRRLAGFHSRHREYDKALDALRRARIVAPEDRELVRDYVTLSVAAGRQDDALREARDLQRREPKYAGGHAIEGEVHLAAKNYAEAQRAYIEALKVEPRGTALALRMHSILIAAGRAADAEVFSNRWIRENPKDMAFRTSVAQLALETKNYQVAAAHYRAIVEIEPKNAGALNNLAWTLAELGDAKALQFAERAVTLAPRSAPALDTLGVLLIRKGEVAKGLDYLDRAVKIDSESPQIRLNYAKALLKAGHKDVARKQLEMLRDVPGDFAGRPEAESLLRGL